MRKGPKNGDLDDELDADPESRDEYEIRWWAVSTDLAGNVTGVSDSDGDTKCTWTR